MKNIAIIGAGITGITTAYQLFMFRVPESFRGGCSFGGLKKKRSHIKRL